LNNKETKQQSGFVPWLLKSKTGGRAGFGLLIF